MKKNHNLLEAQKWLAWLQTGICDAISDTELDVHYPGLTRHYAIDLDEILTYKLPGGLFAETQPSMSWPPAGTGDMPVALLEKFPPDWEKRQLWTALAYFF